MADLVDGLLLLSYPLHPPGRPDKHRTEHFPRPPAPALFVHDAKDSFGSIEEMRSATALIPARCELIEITGARHGLVGKRDPNEATAAAAARVVEGFREFFG